MSALACLSGTGAPRIVLLAPAESPAAPAAAEVAGSSAARAAARATSARRAAAASACAADRAHRPQQSPRTLSAPARRRLRGLRGRGLGRQVHRGHAASHPGAGGRRRGRLRGDGPLCRAGPRRAPSPASRSTAVCSGATGADSFQHDVNCPTLIEVAGRERIGKRNCLEQGPCFVIRDKPLQSKYACTIGTLARMWAWFGKHQGNIYRVGWRPTNISGCAGPTLAGFRPKLRRFRPTLRQVRPKLASLGHIWGLLSKTTGRRPLGRQRRVPPLRRGGGDAAPPLLGSDVEGAVVWHTRRSSSGRRHRRRRRKHLFGAARLIHRRGPAPRFAAATAEPGHPWVHDLWPELGPPPYFAGDAGVVACPMPLMRCGGVRHLCLEAVACHPMCGCGEEATHSVVADVAAGFRCARCGLAGGRLAMLLGHCSVEVPVPRCHVGGAEEPMPVSARAADMARIAGGAGPRAARP